MTKLGEFIRIVDGFVWKRRPTKSEPPTVKPGVARTVSDG